VLPADLVKEVLPVCPISLDRKNDFSLIKHNERTNLMSQMSLEKLEKVDEELERDAGGGLEELPTELLVHTKKLKPRNRAWRGNLRMVAFSRVELWGWEGCGSQE
jgi:hypothetical protein